MSEDRRTGTDRRATPRPGAPERRRGRPCLGDEPRTEKAFTRLTRKEKAFVEAHVKRHGQSLFQWMRDVMADAIAEAGEKLPPDILAPKKRNRSPH